MPSLGTCLANMSKAACSQTNMVLISPCPFTVSDTFSTRLPWPKHCETTCHSSGVYPSEVPCQACPQHTLRDRASGFRTLEGPPRIVCLRPMLICSRAHSWWPLAQAFASHALCLHSAPSFASAMAGYGKARVVVAFPAMGWGALLYEGSSRPFSH